jgi:hypothetical protein
MGKNYCIRWSAFGSQRKCSTCVKKIVAVRRASVARNNLSSRGWESSGVVLKEINFHKVCVTLSVLQSMTCRDRIRERVGIVSCTDQHHRGPVDQPQATASSDEKGRCHPTWDKWQLDGPICFPRFPWPAVTWYERQR